MVIDAVELDATVREWSNFCKQADDVDPSNDLDWQSLWIGFALGRGLSIELATSYRIYMDRVFPLECDSD